MELYKKTLGIAISDCEAERISKKQLFEIFQEAIDNGDILEPENDFYVVSAVLPLVDKGILQSSEHIKIFERRMNQKVKELIALQNKRKKTE